MLEVIDDHVLIQVFHHIRCHVMCSRSFHRMHIRDIGLLLAGHVLSPFLKTDDTLAFNQSEGNGSSCKDSEKITCRICAISQQSFWSSRGLLRSGPGVLSGFKPCSSFMIPFTEMFISFMLWYLFLVSVGALPGLIWPDSWRSCTFCELNCLRVRGVLGLKTDWNCSVRRDLPSEHYLYMNGHPFWGENCLGSLVCSSLCKRRAIWCLGGNHQCLGNHRWTYTTLQVIVVRRCDHKVNAYLLSWIAVGKHPSQITLNLVQVVPLIHVPPYRKCDPR